MSGLGILCPGQGNQHDTMFDILSGHLIAQQVLESAETIFGRHPTDYLQQLSTEQLFANQQAQMLIGLLQLATWEALRDVLPSPIVFAGYSMGEVTAYGCAGAMNLHDTLALIGKRGALMDAASPPSAGLLAVRGLGREQIKMLCGATGLEIAIINGPDHYVLGGPEDALRDIEKHPLSWQATTVKRLPVSVPSHTSWLSHAGHQFSAALESSSIIAPRHPVVAGVNGAMIRTRDGAIQALAEQISQPINWMVCMQSVVEMGCNVILELGPGNALTKMLQEYAPHVTVRSVADFRSLQGVADWMQKQFH